MSHTSTVLAVLVDAGLLPGLASSGVKFGITILITSATDKVAVAG